MTSDPADYFDAERFRQQGHELVDLLASFLEQSTGNEGMKPVERVLDYRDEQTVYEQWKHRKLGGGSAIEVFQEAMAQSIRLHHPRYMGHQISPPATVAALAGLVSDLLNNGMGVYEMGMAGTVIERIVVEMVAEQFGYPVAAGGFLTSGGSLGNLTALLAARNAKMPEVLSEGQQSGQQSRMPAIIVSEQSHYCVQRAVGVMGWGKAGLILAPCNNKFQLDTDRLPALLEKAEADGRQVIAVVGSACSTATGAYDNLRLIGEFCQKEDLWFHVDGAHGAAAAFSEVYRELLDGIELADSVVMDFHKLLLTPALATAVVFRDGRLSHGTFSQKADYLFSEESQEEQWHNLALRTFECTKLMMGLKVYSIIAEHGTAAWDNNVTTLYNLARSLASLVEGTAQMELLVSPQSNIVCYRFVPRDPQSSNEINRMIRERMLSDGKFYIVQTVIKSTHWLRSTIGSVSTGEKELEDLVAEIVRIGNELESAQG